MGEGFPTQDEPEREPAGSGERRQAEAGGSGVQGIHGVVEIETERSTSSTDVPPNTGVVILEGVDESGDVVVKDPR